MTTYNGIVTMGGLFKDGDPCARPTRPWNEYVDIDGAGNVPALNEAASMERWTIGDTPENPENVLRWLHFTDNGREVFICDRNILCAVSWDELNRAGYVEGRVVTIDGKRYLCRLLTGGVDYRRDDPTEDGGTTRNEWDRLIVNEEGIAGLPALTDIDRDPYADFSIQVGTEHNKLWNWVGMWSWCKEVYAKGASRRAVRGCSSARLWRSNSSSLVNSSRGFRPVLEAL